MLPWFSIPWNNFALGVTSSILKISLKYVDPRDTQTETQHDTKVVEMNQLHAGPYVIFGFFRPQLGVVSINSLHFTCSLQNAGL